MRLKAKFNLVLVGAFLIGASVAAALSYRILQDNARREVLQDAAIMMEQASAIRSFTSREVGPLLADQSRLHFLPQTVPDFVAQASFHQLQADFHEYSYREPALNPTDPADTAQPWEADVIDEFRNDSTLKELVTERETASGPILSVSRPVRATDKQCLVCHSTPSVAPASMLDVYGPDHGFGWKLGDVVAAQIVSVPENAALLRADRAFYCFVAGLALVFLLMLVFANLLLHYAVVKPVREITAIAGEVGRGNMEARAFTRRGRDEIAKLAEAFNGMRRSLANALQLIAE